jgi:dihydrofolate reductase
MGKIIISENLTLDGVIEDPTGEEGSEHGGWFNQLQDQDRAAWAQVGLEEALGHEALLIGRRSYEFFSSRWPSRTGAWADRLNTMPKYVVSSTLENPEWTNSTVLKGDPVQQVGALKERLNGDIVVNASGRLARTLIEHQLVDGFRLILYPFVLGSGQRLFADTTLKDPLRLTANQTVGDSLVLLSYDVVRAG